MEIYTNTQTGTVNVPTPSIENPVKTDQDIVIIQVSRKIRDALKVARITKHETYDEVIDRLLAKK